MDILNRSYSVQEVQKDPLAFLEKLCLNEKKDIICYNVEGLDIVLVNNPNYIKTVLQTDEKYFVKDSTPEMMMLRPILGNGLLTSTGAAWKEQRQVAQIGFKMERITSFITIMIDETLDLIKDWQSGATIDLETEMSELTLRIVSRALFGDSLNHVAEEFSHAVRTINLHMGHFDATDTAGRIEFGKALGWLKKVVKDLIEKRRSDTKEYNDFLAMLLENQDKAGFSESDLVDQVFTFLMAGHETTAKSLTWTIYELTRHSDVVDQLAIELKNVLGDSNPGIMTVRNLQYTWNVLQEAMRLNPPVWIISRKATIDYLLDGVLIPKDALVLVSPYLIHRHPAYWDEPLTFNPDRFTKKEDEQRPVYAYIPFSGGPRHCVGQNFASIEVVVVLSTLMNKFEFTLEEHFKVIPEALVTLRPKYGMKMKIKKKQH